jgi:hypothetical protein
MLLAVAGRLARADFSTLANTVMIPSAGVYLQALFTSFVTIRLRLNINSNSHFETFVLRLKLSKTFKLNPLNGKMRVTAV